MEPGKLNLLGAVHRQKRWSRLMQSLRESAAKVGNADSAGDAKKTKTKVSIYFSPTLPFFNPFHAAA